MYTDIDWKKTIFDFESGQNERCEHVKPAIVIINIILPSISFLFLVSVLIRMIIKSKQKTLSLLSKLIMSIFISEIIYCISKLLQMVKYIFIDNRDPTIDNNDFTKNQRSIICAVQIYLALLSDFCTLISTFFLSFKSYDALANKSKLYKKKCLRKCTLVSTYLLSFIFASIFFFYDFYLNLTNNEEKSTDPGKKSISPYRYAIRDRCTYWCWLAHLPSIICYCLFSIIYLANLYYGFKVFGHLKRVGRGLSSSQYEENQENNNNQIKNENNDSHKESLVRFTEDKFENKNEELVRKNTNLTKSQKLFFTDERLQELNAIKAKFFIYPVVTLIIWLISIIYILTDDIIFFKEDQQIYYIITNSSSIESYEKAIKSDTPQQYIVETFLVFYTFISSIRGLLYGFAFLIIEDKFAIQYCFDCCFVSRRKRKLSQATLSSQKEKIKDSIYSSLPTSLPSETPPVNIGEDENQLKESTEDQEESKQQEQEQEQEYYPNDYSTI